MPPRAIGILGGTFAPIHNGHLRLAIEAREQLALDEVRLIPAAQPPLRAVPSIPAPRRFRWVQLAIADEPGLVADDRELQRPGTSYTIDTLKSLRGQFPAASLSLLLGMDTASRIAEWRDWRSLLDFAHLVFFNRPGEAAGFSGEILHWLRDRQARDVTGLREEPRGLWWRCRMAPLDISASRIRELLAAGRSIRGLVPDAVLRDLTSDDVNALAGNEENTPT